MLSGTSSAFIALNRQLHRLAAIVMMAASTCLSAPAQATDGPTRNSATAAPMDPSRAAYVMAWRSSQEATEHSDALRVTETLATRIGLTAGPAYTALEQFIDSELAANPGRFTSADEPENVLAQLLRENVNGFQRTLSPVLSDEAFARYESLLDSLKITAR